MKSSNGGWKQLGRKNSMTRVDVAAAVKERSLKKKPSIGQRKGGADNYGVTFSKGDLEHFQNYFAYL